MLLTPPQAFDEQQVREATMLSMQRPWLSGGTGVPTRFDRSFQMKDVNRAPPTWDARRSRQQAPTQCAALHGLRHHTGFESRVMVPRFLHILICSFLETSTRQLVATVTV